MGHFEMEYLILFGKGILDFDLLHMTHFRSEFRNSRTVPHMEQDHLFHETFQENLEYETDHNWSCSQLLILALKLY